MQTKMNGMQILLCSTQHRSNEALSFGAEDKKKYAFYTFFPQKTVFFKDFAEQIVFNPNSNILF